MRLFCVPYAGGSAAAFAPWLRWFPSSLQICAVELPGRGLRLAATPVKDLEALAADVAESITPYLDRPFALFGHSLGGLLAFEAVRRLRRAGSPTPRQLFVSGAAAPQQARSSSQLHRLPDTALVARLSELGGIPRQILGSPEVIGLFLPVLRADLQAFETYAYTSAPPLDCPILVLGGAHDPVVSPTRLGAWAIETSAECRVAILPGGHFFFNNTALIVSEISRVLGIPIPRWHRVTRHRDLRNRGGVMWSPKP